MMLGNDVLYHLPTLFTPLALFSLVSDSWDGGTCGIKLDEPMDGFAGGC